MSRSILRQSLNAFLLFAVATFLVLALYSAIGQQIFPRIGDYQTELEQYVSDRLDGTVSVRKIWGDMDMLTPSIHIEGLALQEEDLDDAVLSIAAVDAVLDPRLSLLNMTPVFKSVRLSGLSLSIDNRPDPDREENPTKDDADDDSALENLIEALLLQRHLELNGVTIHSWIKGKQRTLQLDHLVMTGDGFHRLVTGSLKFGDEKVIRTGFRFYSEGSPYDLQSFYASGSLDLPQLDLDYWVAEATGEATFDDFNASAQLNFEFDKGLMQKARLHFASPQVVVSEKSAISQLSGDVWLKQSSPNVWTFWLAKSEFMLGGKSQQLADIGVRISRKQDGNRWQLFAKQANVEEWLKLIEPFSMLPKSVDNILQTLKPSGELHKLNVVLDTKQDQPVLYTIAAEAHDVSVASWDGIPAGEHLYGVVAANNNGGRFQLTTPEQQETETEPYQLKLHFPGIYPEPLIANQAQGQVDWFLSEQQLRIVGDGLKLSTDMVESIHGGFQVWVPFEGKLDGQLLLNLGFENADALVHKQLVPMDLDEGLTNWLDEAIKRGRVGSGQLLLMTSLEANSPDPILQLHIGIDDGNLAYLEDWPEAESLKGDLYIDIDRVVAKIYSGASLGGNVSQGRVMFRKDRRGVPSLYVDLSARGDASEGFRYFTETPLQEVVNHALDDWQVQGDNQLNLALKVPLGEQEEDVSVDLTAHLKSAALAMNDVGLSFNQVDGPIGYSSKRGLHSSGIKASMWDKPVSLTASSDVSGGDLISEFKFEGELNSTGLKDWLNLGLLESVTGTAPVTGKFVLDTSEGANSQLDVSSELKGIDLELPSPFGKIADEVRPMNLSFIIGAESDQRQTLKLAYDEHVNLAIQLREGELFGGQIYLGKTEAYVPNDPGLVIQGHVDRIDAKKWLTVWEQIEAQDALYAKQASANSESPEKLIEKESQATKQTDEVPIREIIVSTDVLVYEEHRFENVKTNIKQSKGDWKLHLDTPMVLGDVSLLKDKPIDVNLTYIHWPQTEDEEVEDPDAEQIDPLQALNPAEFPAIRFKAQEIFLGPTNYGQWQVNVDPIKDGARFSELKGEIKKLHVAGEMEWVKNKDSKTSAKIQLSSSDVGGIQKAWLMKPAIEAKKANAEAHLRWAGSPANFSVATLNGSFSFKFEEGGFVEASDASALNVFGILNFGAIGRRLRLDFSDLYQSGLAYDTFKGKTTIENGLVKIVDTMTIDGPAAKFASSGTINLNSKELDQQLSVTIPITSTLPLVAILAGFAPPVAASIYVGEKLVGDELSRFTSATYSVKGTWDDPKLEINKRFDNEIEGIRTQSLWHRMKDFFGLGKKKKDKESESNDE